MTSNATPPAAEPARQGELLEIARTVAGGLAIALALRIVVFQPYTIPSSSMEPGLRTGDYVIVSKASYGWSRASIPFNPPLPGGRLFARAPKRGEVIVFRLPRDPTQVYVKRLIGLPGDRVQVVHGQVVVNGQPIPQQPAGFTEDPEAPGRRVLQLLEPKPDGQRYVTYDAGPDHEGDDTAVYLVPQAHYFFMGDNRDNSLDSRWPQAEGGVDMVPAENLIGKAEVVMLSWKPGAAVLKPWTWLALRPSRVFHRIV
ncbi:MAG: signal peptidase I [Phenylobacterium sp.]|nr:MAG: signal peptidase I [Phenylobacterium sp.]